ncbi:hypothetical protein ALC57_01277, partial [Trachymyrmex cornetzi]
MRTDEESRRTSVTSFIVHTLTHLVNITSLLVETLPRFERQPQFVSAIVSQGDLHVTRRANVDSNFQILVARILLSMFIRYGLYDDDDGDDFDAFSQGYFQYLVSSFFFGEVLCDSFCKRDSMSSYTKVSMCMRSRSSSRSKFHSHVRFSRPLTYTIQYKHLTLAYVLSAFVRTEIQSASVFVRSEIQSATLFHRAIVTLQLFELMPRGFAVVHRFATLAALPIKDPRAPSIGRNGIA